MRLPAVGCLAVLALAGCGARRHQPTNAAPARAAFDAYVIEFWIKRDSAALDRALAPDLAYHYNGQVVPSVPANHHRSAVGGELHVPGEGGTDRRAVKTWDEGGFYRKLGVDPAKCG